MALRFFYLEYYTLAILWGCYSALTANVYVSALFDLLFRVAMSVCLALWAVADARQFYKPIPRFQQQWFVLLALVLVPGYVIVTRRWRGVGWVLVHALGWMLISTAFGYVAALSAWEWTR